MKKSGALVTVLGGPLARHKKETTRVGSTGIWFVTLKRMHRLLPMERLSTQTEDSRFDETYNYGEGGAAPPLKKKSAI